MHCKRNAYFVYYCWGDTNETNASPYRYVLSWKKDLCEGCGEYKRVIVVERLWSRMQRNLFETVRFSMKSDSE